MKPPQITETERKGPLLTAQRRNELEAGRLAQPQRHFHEPSRLELLDHARGISVALAVTMIRSYGAPRRVALAAVAGDDLDARPFSACARAAAVSGSMSTVTTRPAPDDCRAGAALYPVPAPISSTRCPGSSRSSSSISAMIPGCDDDESPRPDSVCFVRIAWSSVGGLDGDLRHEVLAR